jgi:hypothetical protein
MEKYASIYYRNIDVTYKENLGILHWIFYHPHKAPSLKYFSSQVSVAHAWSPSYLGD